MDDFSGYGGASDAEVSAAETQLRAVQIGTASEHTSPQLSPQQTHTEQKQDESDLNSSFNISTSELKFSLDEDYDDDERFNEFLNSTAVSDTGAADIVRTQNLNRLKSQHTGRRSSSVASPTPRDQDEFHFQLGYKHRDVLRQLDGGSEAETVEKEVSPDPRVSPDPQDRNSQVSLVSPDSPDSARSEQSSAFIDDVDVELTPKIPKMNPEATPWRHLRPASAYRDGKDKQSVTYMKSLFDSADNSEEMRSPARSISLFESRTSSAMSSNITAATNQYEVEHLKKQITNYKIQHKLLIEFIKKIFNEGTDNESALHSEMLKNLATNQESLLTNLNINELNDKIKEITDLKNDLSSTENLNKELNSYIDELKLELSENLEIMESFSDNQDNWLRILNEILSLFKKVSSSFGGEIDSVIASDDIELKFKTIKSLIKEVLEKNELNEKKLDELKENEETIFLLQNLLIEKDDEVKLLKKTPAPTVVKTETDEYTELNSLKLQNTELLQSLQQCQVEINSKEKAYKDQIERVTAELDESVVRQRKISSDRSKLNYLVEELKLEKTELLKYKRNLMIENKENLEIIEGLRKYQTGFNEVLKLLIGYFKKVILKFKQIFEEKSIEQAEEKINKLSRLCDLNHNEIDTNRILSILNNLFNYFEIVIESLINDIIGNAKVQNRNNNEINELRVELEALRKSMGNDKASGSPDSSPRTKLRISELEKLKKLERERRKLDHLASQEIITKLETENQQLKEEIARLRS